MRYYQCDKYPIEFVLSENIDKHFDSHNHAGYYVISMVMQGAATVYLENREVVCCRGDFSGAVTERSGAGYFRKGAKGKIANFHANGLPPPGQWPERDGCRYKNSG